MRKRRENWDEESQMTLQQLGAEVDTAAATPKNERGI
jgi:hypothetical protein